MTTKAPSEGKKILVEVELSQLRPDVTCRRCDENGDGYYAKGRIPDGKGNELVTWLCPKCAAALESPRGTNAPSELLLQIKNDFILTMPQSRAGKPISMKEAASLRVYKGLTELGEILRADSHSDAALAALKEKANDGAIKAAVLMMRTQLGSERSYQCGREAAFKDVIRWISEAGTQKQEGAQ